MDKYHIYGIGGALVDTEIEVSDKFLVDAKIDKGVMTLVNELRQNELISAIKSDDIPLIQRSGGSVCNSVVAASSLGANVFFSGKVADDADGELFVKDLIRTGVRFHSASQEPGTTGKCLVMITPDAERTMNTFLGISERLSAKEIDEGALENSEWFYVEGYLVADESRVMVIKDAVKRARMSGVKIALSLSDPFVVKLYGEELRDLIANGVDLIFCNKKEALAFANINDLDSAMENLKQYTKTFAITDGPSGAITFDGELILSTDGVPTKAVDTNGAGDMFAGAFLYAITAGMNYYQAARLANCCAARVVAKFGPRLESEDFDEIKSKFGI